MIPSDVASALRLQLPDQSKLTANLSQNQPVVSAQRLTDVLSDLVPGQRLMAEIQALLPNGTYRAVVAQREITLALPFSAKPGDSLELEVVETNGKVALAFVADRTASAQAGAARESVATTLSQTGKLIGNLLGGIDDKEKGAAPAPLNGSRPLVDAMPTTAADLAPVLKQALSQSGMFYEAHQARWVAGELPTALLLQEPQGQHSQAGTLAGELAAKANGQTATGGNALAQPASTLPGSENVRPEAHSTQVTQTGTAFYQQVMMNDATDSGSGRLEQTGPAVLSPQQGALPADLAPLVQQQLNALATQTFTWQGQIWPGQQMFWEIDDQQGNQGRGNEGTASQWQTRLKLNLPQLGGIDASLRLLPGNEIEISLSAAQGESGAKLDSFSQTLKQQLAAAGLKLTQFGVKNGSPAE